MTNLCYKNRKLILKCNSHHNFADFQFQCFFLVQLLEEIVLKITKCISNGNNDKIKSSNDI